jgi:hypothetical protein
MGMELEARRKEGAKILQKIQREIARKFYRKASAITIKRQEAEYRRWIAEGKPER